MNERRKNMKKNIYENIEAQLPRFSEAVDVVVLHLRYIMIKNKMIPPEEAIHRVYGRVKSIESIKRKVKKKSIKVNSISSIYRNIYDIAGVRVICDYLPDIPFIHGFIEAHRGWIIIPNLTEDYITKPKESGYRALHLVVIVPTSWGNTKCEIQMQTMLQYCSNILGHRKRTA